MAETVKVWVSETDNENGPRYAVNEIDEMSDNFRDVPTGVFATFEDYLLAYPSVDIPKDILDSTDEIRDAWIDESGILND